jgi:hypothetical protein
MTLTEYSVRLQKGRYFSLIFVDLYPYMFQELLAALRHHFPAKSTVLSALPIAQPSMWNPLFALMALQICRPQAQSL